MKSLSNTKAELHAKAMTTLAGQGSVEFWVVDQETETVTVYTKTSGMHVYQRSAGKVVPVPILSGHIDLDQLFGRHEVDTIPLQQ